MVKTIKIKRGAKMHILANGAGRNLRSTITNHLNIRIMKSTFVTWRTVENNGNSESVSIARHTTRQAAMSYLGKIAKKYKTEVKFLKGTEFGGAPAIWAWHVQVGNVTYENTEEG